MVSVSLRKWLAFVLHPVRNGPASESISFWAAQYSTVRGLGGSRPERLLVWICVLVTVLCREPIIYAFKACQAGNLRGLEDGNANRRREWKSAPVELKMHDPFPQRGNTGERPRPGGQLLSSHT